MKKLHYFALATLMLCSASMSAQQATSSEDYNHNWYVGVEGGVPFGFGSFTSFGHDKTRAGYNAGLYGGYRFNPVLSAELSAKWGQTSLSSRDCCVDAGYWLGADAVRYYAPVSGLDGWNYADIKSRVCMQQYGARLNVNILGFFNATKSSRWTLSVSPAVYAVGTKASIRTIADSRQAIGNNTKWHLGYGGRLQAGYMITRNLNIGLYSELTALTGSQLDGIAECRHDHNFVWESGIRLGWSFGKTKKAPQIVVPAEPEPEVCPVEPEQTVVPAEPAKPVVITPAEPEPAPVELSFPVIYFDFDKYNIKDSEQSKLQAMADLLNEHPDINITLTGWCDKYGSDNVNARISLRRAQAVKSWLVNHGIDANRISTVGSGRDLDSQNAVSARRVVTHQK